MTPVPALSAADPELLRQFDTPTVCNVIELFDLRSRAGGYMDARIQACYPSLRPMVGYASTATFRSAAPPLVVFQDLDQPFAAATFGEVMCTTYKAFGAAGLITSGAGRDLDQVEVLQFPCFTSGTICAHGSCHIVQVNVAVRVGGLAVHPGDLLHGDRNGVTLVPNHLASAAAQACPDLVAAEAVILDYLRGGKVEAQGFAAARKESQRRIEALGKKLHGQ